MGQIHFNYIKPLTIILGAVIVLNLLLMRAFQGLAVMGYATITGQYVFFYVLALVHMATLLWLLKKWPKYFGLLFTGLSLIKMAICLVYLFPDVYPPHDLSIKIAMNFMVVYFILLTFEVIYFLKHLNQHNKI